MRLTHAVKFYNVYIINHHEWDKTKGGNGVPQAMTVASSNEGRKSFHNTINGVEDLSQKMNQTNYLHARRRPKDTN